MSAAPGKNPYRPGVGTKPAYLAGREGPMRRFRAVLRSAPEQPANMRLTGLRGVGKTVLLGEFEQLAKDNGWAAGFLELNPRHNTDEALAAMVAALSSRVREEISRAERLRSKLGRAVRAGGSLGVTYNDVKLSLDPSTADGTADVAKELFELVEVSVANGRDGVVLLLDEAQVVRDERDRRGQHPLSLLISAIAALQRRDLPLGVVLCGLPTLTGNLLQARSYTERMFRGEDICRLDAESAAAAFSEPLRGRPIVADDKLVEAVVREVEGYPYFIQLWGAELWDAAEIGEVSTLDERLLELTTSDIYRRLDIDFYEPRVYTLTPAEQDVLLATADCPYPPIATLDLNDAVDKSPGNINVLLGRLVETGVLYRVRKGQYEYTAPKFREYLLRRTVDDF